MARQGLVGRPLQLHRTFSVGDIITGTMDFGTLAWGWDDPGYSYYPYDGPILLPYNNLPPDQVVANVQSAPARTGILSMAKWMAPL